MQAPCRNHPSCPKAEEEVSDFTPPQAFSLRSCDFFEGNSSFPLRPLLLPFPRHGRPQLARSENVPQKSHSIFSAAGGMGGQRRRQILRSGASKASSSLPFSRLTSQGAGAEKINILRKKKMGRRKEDVGGWGKRKERKVGRIGTQRFLGGGWSD